MKLKVRTTSVDRLKNSIVPIVSLRKHAILRFTPQGLNVISSEFNETTVWCTLAAEIFDIYEVESLRDNTITIELNIEHLLLVLRQYEKSNADKITIRLHRKEATGGGSTTRASKLNLLLNVFFINTISLMSTTPVEHTYSIPVTMLKKERDAKIVEPHLDNIDVMMKLPRDIGLLFKRIERYKYSDKLNVIGTSAGQLSLNINVENSMDLTISWNQELEVRELDTEEHTSASQMDDEEEAGESKYEIQVKMKDWKLGARLCDFSQKRHWCYTDTWMKKKRVR
ncbi:Mec3p CYBJADRAFT_175097 [Cyberlindnera jadinii NRRL Y-1542]|uniref:Checkpoint protein n=1 Tax=Cyberlindnera jadinii (strain ATCC 18201 / CBS 1600 / BCRC 20928 / JCM 3617 / NBRC 0987 / NRRL Y-1542) TaxID=983966 RepID=A0A1E4RVQ4_CYBJN|nr:hypothetical protein CYBJADRAFT_175097 [Cyberlindnera jadinii NRRL Y-1542]ODV71357.1 hypothetical protein CYBJADRAFT_175097 [Cyberlindnera jadinii NRRL Y-1542]